MYFDEDVVLDLRLNYLNNYVDKFVIVEKALPIKGNDRQLNFNIKKFEKFKKKIEYIILDHEPSNIEKVEGKDDENTKNSKYILNGMRRDFYQRNFIRHGLKDALEDDFILISDLDEIPKLDNLDFNSIKEKLIFTKNVLL